MLLLMVSSCAESRRWLLGLSDSYRHRRPSSSPHSSGGISSRISLPQRELPAAIASVPGSDQMPIVAARHQSDHGATVMLPLAVPPQLAHHQHDALDLAPLAGDSGLAFLQYLMHQLETVSQPESAFRSAASALLKLFTVLAWDCPIARLPTYVACMSQL